MSKLKLSALHLAIGSTLLSGLAFNASAADDSAEEVERIEITGSRIKRTDIENAVPVTVISADDMVRQGFTNVQDALASLSSVTGATNQQSIHGFTPAASSISLRNAGANRTLTLINGKRLNQYPKPQNGTDNFVDTANLPMDAISRIEILNSGGGAIYGADAVGGVVNIILKDNFEGVSIRARHGDTTEGGGANNKISMSFGASSDKGNVSTFLEYTDSETLKATDRENFGLHTDKVPYSEHSSYSSYGARIGGFATADGLNESECTAGGFFYRPNGVCGFDRSKWRDLSPEQKRVSAITTFNYELSDDLRFSGRVDISESSSIRDIEPMGIDSYDVNVAGDVLTMTAGDNSASFNKATGFGGDFKNAEDGDYWYVRRAWEFGNRHQTNEGRNFFISAGLEGEFSDSITWDASMNFGRTRVEVFSRGYATVDGMFKYLTQGENGVSMLAPFSDEMVEATAYGTYEIANASRINYQFNLAGDAFELPAGMVSFATGVEWSKQTYDTDTDAESKKGAILTTGGSSGAGARDNWAIYSEMIFPVLDTLNVNAALRYDDYSDFGGELTPQVSVEYRPMDELLVRGVVGQVFRAPDMHRVYGDATRGSNQVIDFKGCAQIGGTPGDKIDRIIDPCNELHIDTVTGANKDLKAETGYTANVGFVYSTDDYNVSVDLWKWKLDDMVNDIDVEKVAEYYELYGDMITRDTNGFVDTITATAQNLSYQEVAGIDFNGTYTWNFDNLGDLSYNLQGAYILQSEGQVDATSPIDKDLEDTNLVRLRMTSALTWSLDDLTTTLFAKYIGRHHGTSYKTHKTDEKSESELEVASHITWNLTTGYNITDDASVRLGVVNMFDKGPNFDPTHTSWPHYPRGYYDPAGRKVFIEAEYKF
ncbi:TonB-dependent receptor [Pseudoalteromonas sp. C2R02]|uniref:TonB-dependent receptor plug domain-containing protein n=1 Tax=Pseudoalteromonas sp. C2R02 TaxID=2841565 RepID=UPI001C0A4BF2|nr:TonB-dependent receptor [Pseudoalteromonas sp. C2R02]MBU2967854.1 TonB-dependent receptor [Pseudoalteromonas sp. C2R02]